jgi:site-specific recombinase XerD
MKQSFSAFLKAKNLSMNTIKSYTKTVEEFQARFGEATKNNLLAFKGYLLERRKPKTVNLRIQGINRYLDYISKKELALTAIRIQQKPFLENVISDADYFFLKKSLRNDDLLEWYFVVRFLGATGARISELVQMKIEHVICGNFDIYSKGGKTRRIYIPKRLCAEALEWLTKNKRESGYLFVNRHGDRISTRGIAIQLKKYAARYHINPDVVYPHSFRHRFAKNFIEKYKDISLLADLMGHDSIETTRIYLRRTATEQKAIVDKIVTW